MFTAMFIKILLLACVLPTFSLALSTPLVVQESWKIDHLRDNDVKVPVVLGVMSRCPDALLCESIFDQVLKRTADKIDFGLTYVATVNSAEPDFGVTCKHGPDECAGNIQQLCVAKYHPLQTWWEFVMCQDYQTRNHIGRPDVALMCARAAQIDWETSGPGQCAGLDASGKAEEGIQLLKESIAVTNALHIQKSCTVVINGQHVCIHDETWKQCENGHTALDFVRQINTEYARLNNLTFVMNDDDLY